MKRTIQTAEAVGVPYEQWKALNEIDAVSILFMNAKQNLPFFSRYCVNGHPVCVCLGCLRGTHV